MPRQIGQIGKSLKPIVIWQVYWIDDAGIDADYSLLCSEYTLGISDMKFKNVTTIVRCSVLPILYVSRRNKAYLSKENGSIHTNLTAN